MQQSQIYAIGTLGIKWSAKEMVLTRPLRLFELKVRIETLPIYSLLATALSRSRNALALDV